MTCRDEVIDAMVRLEKRHGKSVFQLGLIVKEVLSYTSQYEESTIRTHITAHMCAQAPINAAVVTDDLDRVGRGLYKLRYGKPKAKSKFFCNRCLKPHTTYEDVLNCTNPVRGNKKAYRRQIRRKAKKIPLPIPPNPNVYHFSDWPIEIPALPGVYAIWKGKTLIYVGEAGRNWTEKKPGSGHLKGRLSDHARAQRADVFPTYVFERFVGRTLQDSDWKLIESGEKHMNEYARDFIRSELSFSYLPTSDWTTAKSMESDIQRGALGQRPIINPA